MYGASDRRRALAGERLELVLKTRRSTIVTLSLVLSACAPAPQPPQVALWSKSGARDNAFLQDRSACIQAAHTTGSSGFVSGGAGELPPGAALSDNAVNA